jgi:hypothetical protein
MDNAAKPKLPLLIFYGTVASTWLKTYRSIEIRVPIPLIRKVWYRATIKFPMDTLPSPLYERLSTVPLLRASPEEERT